MKIILLNTLKEPLGVPIKHGPYIKFRQKGQREIDEAYLESPRIKYHLDRGNLIILKKKETVPVTSAEKKVEGNKADGIKEKDSKISEVHVGNSKTKTSKAELKAKGEE